MDRINDSEMNADKRELAALRQSVGDVVTKMKADHAAHVAADIRSNKQMIAGLSILFVLTVFHVVTELFPVATVSITNAVLDEPANPNTLTLGTSTATSVSIADVEGAKRQRDRSGVSAWLQAHRIYTCADLIPSKDLGCLPGAWETCVDGDGRGWHCEVVSYVLDGFAP